VENQLGEKITFFHLDCLCSDVRLNVDFDLTLTVVADLLYRSLAGRLKGFARVGPARLFRKFVDTPGDIEITTGGVLAAMGLHSCSSSFRGSPIPAMHSPPVRSPPVSTFLP